MKLKLWREKSLLGSLKVANRAPKNNVLETKGRDSLALDVKMKCALAVSPLATLANICERNRDDGSLKTNKVTNILCSLKIHLQKGGKVRTRGGIGLRELL